MAHNRQVCGGEALRLSEASPRDVSWKEVYPTKQLVATGYAGTRYDKYFERMQGCSGWLDFALVPTGTDEPVHKLQSAHFCHVRHCPICSWRKSLQLRARAFRGMVKILADYPGKRYIFLTLTVRNCKLDQLGKTLTWMNESWQRLTDRKEFPAIGWLRSVEVTRGKDGTAHPHFHALLMVNSNYFTKGYLSQKRWRELWAESLRIDYDPQVDIKVVKPLKQSTISVTSETQDDVAQPKIQPIDNGIATAIRYTLKYSTKPDDWLSTDTSVSGLSKESQEWLLGITKQLHKRRSIALGGIFKKYMVKLETEPKNLVVDEESTDTSETQDEDPRITYVWRDEASDYLLAA